MTQIIIALVIGIVAALIDTFPMLKLPVPRFSVYAIFAQWVFIGLLIPFINWDILFWLKGLLIAELGMIPFLIIAYHRNKKSIVPIIGMAAFLGLLISFSNQYLPGLLL